MNKYKYIAMDIKGSEVEGVIDAISQAEAISKIREKGLFPTRVEDVTDPKTIKLKKPSNSFPSSYPVTATNSPSTSVFSRITAAEVTAFIRKISYLVDAGLPLLRAFRILARQEKNAKLAKVIFGMSEAIEGGSTFSEALTMYPKVFNRTVVNMVKAGEAGGVLEVTTARLADYLDKENEVKSSMISSFFMMLMSAIVMSVLIAILGTVWVLNPIVVGIISLLVIGIFIGRMYNKLDKSRDFATIARMLGTLLSSGVPVLQALNLTRDNCRRASFREAMQRVHDSVKEGDTISMPLEACKFPSIFVSMIDVGEETGALPEMLVKIAEMYDKDIDTQLGKINRVNSIVLSMSIAIVAILSVAK